MAVQQVEGGALVVQRHMTVDVHGHFDSRVSDDFITIPWMNPEREQEADTAGAQVM
jgi:hypothetical protein